MARLKPTVWDKLKKDIYWEYQPDIRKTGTIKVIGARKELREEGSGESLVHDPTILNTAECGNTMAGQLPTTDCCNDRRKKVSGRTDPKNETLTTHAGL